MIDREVQLAARIIRSGRIILYPTDTIWGIGCDATNAASVERIYEIKERKDNRQMLVLMDSPEMLTRFIDRVPSEAIRLVKSPEKPTTVIYPGARHLAENLIAEDGSAGIRIPDDRFCRELIAATGKPIVSTSANISGSPAPSLFHEIDPVIVSRVDHVVKWRQDDLSRASPSRIIRLDPQGGISVLRP